MKNTNTKTFEIEYGVVKDGLLTLPVEGNAYTYAEHIIQSYLDWRFRPQSGIFSDAVALSSIGKSHFFEAVFSGLDERIQNKEFCKWIKDFCSDIYLAIAIAKRRNPELTHDEASRKALKNEALSEKDRRSLNISVDIASGMTAEELQKKYA